ncbi:MAG: type II/IV secretion system ATPase subunit [Nanopusillaceae archaeon]
MDIILNLKPKIPIIEIPQKIENTNIIYPLIEPFAYAKIYYNKNKSILLYNVLEPSLSEDEKKLLDSVKLGVKDLLFVKLSDIEDYKKALSYLKRIYDLLLKEMSIKLNKKQYQKIFYYVFRDIYGYGKIEPLMRDPFIEDISCTGVLSPIYIVHRFFGNLETNIYFLNEEEILDTIEKFALRSKKYISFSDPILDATLPDGSRVNATYSKEITTRGPTFTIRKFRENPWTPIDLIKIGSVSPEILAYLWLAIEYRRNIIIIGSTSSGKTTFLNAISMFIPPSAKIVSIEDTREIKLYHKNWIPSTIKYSNDKNKEIDMFTLLKEAMRQNPNYLIVGEVRGKEAYVMFQAMASGHASISTMHAESTDALIYRLISPPIELPESLVNLLDLSVLMFHDITTGKNIRKVRQIDEIINRKRYNTIFYWDPSEKLFKSNYKSYMLYKIHTEYGVSYEDLIRELTTRSKLLNRLTAYKISPEDFFKIINNYYFNKEYILNLFKIL